MSFQSRQDAEKSDLDGGSKIFLELENGTEVCTNVPTGWGSTSSEVAKRLCKELNSADENTLYICVGDKIVRREFIWGARVVENKSDLSTVIQISAPREPSQ